MLPAGEHVIEIYCDGYISVTLNIFVHEDGTITGAEETVVMELLTCKGGVTDVLGRPLAGAQITAVGWRQ